MTNSLPHELPPRYTEPNTGLEFVLIPGGQFQMGSPRQEPSRDSDEVLHNVTVGTYYLSTTEVTFAAFDRFTAATGYGKPADEGWGRGSRPVINVSWLDAQAFLHWLSALTRQDYRLPTEAEWEYAARAGTRSPYWWGQSIGHNRANCNGCGSRWDGQMTAPTSSFPPNPWGIYDTVGNVWEWTCSVWPNQYQGLENRCANDSTHSVERVYRGGSWRYRPKRVRAANRIGYSIHHRDIDLGFRVLGEAVAGSH